MQARENDDRLTDEEITSTAILLFAAGFETTTNLLGNGLLALLRHPDQLADWRAIPTSPPPQSRSCCASTARCSSTCAPRSSRPTSSASRSPRGDRIVVLQGAANHDPARFDRPDELDLRRDDNAPLSFGWGIHHCIGAPLARMEGEIAFNALLARFPTMELIARRGALAPQLHAARAARPAAARVSRLSASAVPSPGGPIADASGPRRST